MSKSKLTHLDNAGNANMVDVGQKDITERTAIAAGEVVMAPETLTEVLAGHNKKGDLFTVAKIAGIMAAKKTSDLIPLCHPLNLLKVDVQIYPDESLPGVRIESFVRVEGKTGVEMEALTAVSVCALTVYDMAKAIDKTMTIQNIRLLEKHGGKSGDFINR